MLEALFVFLGSNVMFYLGIVILVKCPNNAWLKKVMPQASSINLRFTSVIASKMLALSHTILLDFHVNNDNGNNIDSNDNINNVNNAILFHYIIKLSIILNTHQL